MTLVDRSEDLNFVFITGEYCPRKTSKLSLNRCQFRGRQTSNVKSKRIGPGPRVTLKKDTQTKGRSVPNDISGQKVRTPVTKRNTGVKRMSMFFSTKKSDKL